MVWSSDFWSKEEGDGRDEARASLPAIGPVREGYRVGLLPRFPREPKGRGIG